MCEGAFAVEVGLEQIPSSTSSTTSETIDYNLRPLPVVIDYKEEDSSESSREENLEEASTTSSSPPQSLNEKLETAKTCDKVQLTVQKIVC